MKNFKKLGVTVSAVLLLVGGGINMTSASAVLNNNQNGQTVAYDVDGGDQSEELFFSSWRTAVMGHIQDGSIHNHNIQEQLINQCRNYYISHGISDQANIDDDPYFTRLFDFIGNGCRLQGWYDPNENDFIETEGGLIESNQHAIMSIFGITHP